MGRKNFYGNRSERGAKTTAILYSLIDTAKLLYSLIDTAKLRDVDPAEYLREAAVAAIRRPGTVTLPS